MPTSKRRSYSREKKLQILKYYHENGRNKYRMCQKFGIAKGCLYQWIKKEKQIFDGSKGSKRVEGGGRRPIWPDVEEKLVAEFTGLRANGLKVKHYWFCTRAVQLMERMWTSKFRLAGSTASRREINCLIEGLLMSPKANQLTWKTKFDISSGDQTCCSIERFR